MPAILHQDNSARVQTISQNENELLYGIIDSFYRATGVPMLCNTSLNDRGEPIVNRIDEALNFALRKGIGVVYIDEKRLKLCNHSSFAEIEPTPRRSGEFRMNPRLEALLRKTYDPYNLPTDFYLYFSLKEDRDKYDLKDEGDVKILIDFAFEVTHGNSKMASKQRAAINNGRMWQYGAGIGCGT